MYKIAINHMALTDKLAQGDTRWSKFNDGFENVELELIDIANAIYTGHAYTTWHTGRRSLENFICAQHIAVDMDTGDERSSIEHLEQLDLVKMYASLMHTTPSHTPEAPRARILFLLDECITDATGYQTAAKFLISQFSGADIACTDASRFFYGAQNCEIWLSENMLPVEQLRCFYRRWQRTQAKQQPNNVISMEERRAQKTPAEVLIKPVEQAASGSRNVTLNRQAFLAGKDIANGRISESEIVAQLLSAARQVGLSDAEALRTIHSGVRAGQTKAL